MSSRAEEKERRRQERLAAEQAARKNADRRKRLGLVGGAVLGIAVIAVVALLLVGGGDDEPGGGGATAAIPARQITDLEEAVQAADCRLAEDQESEGDTHVADAVTYRANPPHSGDHDPQAALDGFYEPDNPPDLEQSVHALEHGRINIQYKPGTPQARIDQLRTLYEEEVKGSPGYKTLVFENQTDMDAAVAATAWRWTLTCASWNDRVFDAIRAFRQERVDKGPEFIPPTDG